MPNPTPPPVAMRLSRLRSHAFAVQVERLIGRLGSVGRILGGCHTASRSVLCAVTVRANGLRTQHPAGMLCGIQTGFARWALVAVLALCSATSAHAELRFYAPYDQSTDALAAGSPAGRSAHSDAAFSLTHDGTAMWGQALDATAGRGGVRYAAAGNLDLARGTVEMFIRIEDFGKDWQDHRLFVAGATAFDHVFSLGFHPQGEHVIFDWNFNGTKGWFHVKKFLQLGQWHHVAATWDTTAGPGKGELTLYIDGQPRGRAKDLTAFAAPPTAFTVGSDPQGIRTLVGYIDDFAIDDAVRYTGPFTPRTAPLADEAAAIAPQPPSISQETSPMTVQASSSAAAESVLINGGFEQWQDGKPVGWEVGDGAYAADPAMRVAGGQALRMAIQPGQPNRWPSTMVAQQVELEPGTDYNLRLWLAKDGQGKVLIRVHALRNGRVVAEDAPLDWTNGWSRFFVWTPVELAFRTGAETSYRLSVVQFGGVGEPVWIDGVELARAEQNTAAVTADDRARGLQVFSRSVMRPFDARTTPEPGEPTDALHVAAARGEYEPVLLAARVLRRLESVDVRLRGDLAGPGGATLPAEQVVVRTVAEQALLPLTRPRDAEAGQSLGWWITVQPPTDAAAGVYRGTLEVVVGEEVVREVALTVDVAPFELPEPDIAMLVYHNERYFPDGGYLTDELRAAYYRDMREHGMNSVTIYNNPDIDGKRIDLGRDYAYAPGVMDVEALNKRGYKLTEEEIAQRFEYGLSDVLPMVMASGLGTTGQPALWLVQKSERYGWGGMPGEALKAALSTWLEHSDWPTPLLYVQDEPEGHPDRIADARRILDNVASWNLPVQTVTANVAVEELGADYDIWIQLEKRVTPEMVQAAREKDAKLWVYNCNVPTDNAPFTRALFGFWAYRARIGGVALWAYYDAMNWYIDEAGVVHGRNGQFALGRICPSPAGPVPTVSWETTREGVDDYRYAMLLDQLTEEVRQRSAALAEKAEAVLDAAARSAIDARESDAQGKAQWTPADAAQAEAEQVYLAARRLRGLVNVAEQARAQLIGSIPADVLATHAAVPFMEANARHYPALGPGDPQTIAEHKRDALRGYLLRLHAALAETVQ